MAAHPPTSLLEVLGKLDVTEALAADDPRHVDTRAARGSEHTLNRLARKLGYDIPTGGFFPPLTRHILFFGHTGSGKTTELRQYAKQLTGPQRFLVSEVDIGAMLDPHNLQYADILMAMAEQLLTDLERQNVLLSDAALDPLKQWFCERVLTSDKTNEYKAEIESGLQGSLGIPGLAALFSKFTAAFKTNATYKDSMRTVVRNTFGSFAQAFNALLRSAETALETGNNAKRVVFVVDGTDKLRGEDASNLFVRDAEQLLAIDALVIYSAPLHLKYEGNTSRLDDLVLPMMKLQERDDTRCEAGWRALRDILLRRADASLFASDAEIVRIVECSGGHPREMLRLLKLSCEFAEGSTIDAASVDRAVRQLAADFRRFLEPDDYERLAQIDAAPQHIGNDERTRKLLYQLALLEYNDGSWRRSHPAVRLLEGYLRAVDALKTP